MPRPGPRPYECVRKAWHSERHQAMRGSVLQQIFRVVHETHKSDTRKNKEWLEKLPVVVLKAEEIMYSKAMSEIEYMNQETLWNRLNDAVDTIIRRDETSESAELLPPCIEAALILGCTPVRASRNQRHSNPRRYLNHLGRQAPSSSYQSMAFGSTRDESYPISLFPLNNARGTCPQFVSNVAATVSDCHSHKNDWVNQSLSRSLVNRSIGAVHPLSCNNYSYSQHQSEAQAEAEPSQCDLSLRLSLFSENWPSSQILPAREEDNVHGYESNCLSNRIPPTAWFLEKEARSSSDQQ